jgi:hypothetical protein
MDDEKSQKAWISHFVGNWLVRATFRTSRGESAVPVRDELVDKLHSKTSGTLVDELVELTQRYDWVNSSGVEDFRREYFAFARKYEIRG